MQNSFPRFSLMLPFRSFIIFYFTFRYLIHFELIFVQSVRSMFTFIYLLVDVPFVEKTNLASLHYIFSLSKIVHLAPNHSGKTSRCSLSNMRLGLVFLQIFFIKLWMFSSISSLLRVFIINGSGFGQIVFLHLLIVVMVYQCNGFINLFLNVEQVLHNWDISLGSCV